MTLADESLPAPVRAYLWEVRRALAFDPTLAARVTAEIEDHLSTAETDAPEALLRGFGSPQTLAQEFAAAQAPQKLWSSARLMLTVLLMITLTMRLRIAVLPEIPAEPWLWLAGLGDRYGLVVALAGSLLTARAARRLSRGQVWPLWANPLRLTLITLTALVISCLGGMILTGAGLSRATIWQASAPLLTTGAELVALGLLLVDQRRLHYYPGLGAPKMTRN